jgi:hypothetical protein
MRPARMDDTLIRQQHMAGVNCNSADAARKHLLRSTGHGLAFAPTVIVASTWSAAVPLLGGGAGSNSRALAGCLGPWARACKRVVAIGVKQQPTHSEILSPHPKPWMLAGASCAPLLHFIAWAALACNRAQGQGSC